MNRLPHLTEPAHHLSDEQFYCLLEDSSVATEPTRLHLRSCSACQAELSTMQAAFANLRVAATAYAAAQTPYRAPRAIVAPQKQVWMRRPLWAASFAGAVAVLGILLSLTLSRQPAPPVQPPAVAQAAPQVSDEALLEGTQRDLSTSVPPSLEPLEVSATVSAKDLQN
jgi:hypothetical protein